jgi:Fe2+ transport system protein FeoA
MIAKNIILLSETRAGQKVKVASIEAGKVLNSRLAALGLIKNTELGVVNNGHPGPFVVKVKGSTMMLGKGIAHKIKVFN